jgi:hypothetical protein
MTGLPELPDLPITPRVEAVLAALAATGRRKVSATYLSRASHVTVGTVRKVLKDLKAARLAQCVDERHLPDRPPHAVWWLTGAGEALAARLAERRAAPPAQPAAAPD